MDKELQNKLVEILANLQSNIGQAKDFTLAQLPDIAQSYIIYGKWYLTILELLLVIGIFLCFSSIVYCSNRIQDDYSADGYIAIFISGIVLSIGLAVAFFVHLPELMLVWLAPKVWLLKELAHLVR